MRKPKFQKTEFRRTTLIICGLFGIMIGLWLSRYNLGLPLWLILLPFALVPLAFKKNLRALMIISCIGLSIGLVRGNYVAQNVANYERLIGQQITLTGKISEDTTYHESGQTDAYMSDVKHGSQSLPGKVRIRAFVSPEGIERGDRVKVSGKLYEGFGSYQASISYASIELVSRSDRIVDTVRKEFFASIYSVLPEPQASLGLGFLVGLRALLPDDLVDQLSRTGLVHIVAVSGYNLTVLVRVARRFFMRISKFSATAISFSLITFFLAITGLAPSIFRASIVAGFALIAWYYGRPIRPMMLLGLSGAITAMINPILIWQDLGWWLSFTAFFGVLILAPTLVRRFFNKDASELPMLLQIMIETICAQVMALPIIMVVFGELSLISVLANMLIVPFIPVAMALTFIAGLTGIFAPVIAGWIAIPAKVLLTSMTSMIELLSAPDWALIEVDISWGVAIAWYAAVLLILVSIYNKLSIQQKQQLAQVNHLE